MKIVQRSKDRIGSDDSHMSNDVEEYIATPRQVSIDGKCMEGLNTYRKVKR